MSKTIRHIESRQPRAEPGSRRHAAEPGFPPAAFGVSRGVETSELENRTPRLVRRLGPGLAAALLACATAHAQSSASSGGSDTAGVHTDPNLLIAASGSAGPSGNQIIAPPVGASGAEPLAGPAPNAAISAIPATGPYDSVQWKGLIFNLPPPPVTIDGDYAFRRKLAQDYGIGYSAWSVNLFYDNVLRHNHGSPQVYNGQKPTGDTLNSANVVVDLSRYGIPDGQIVVEGVYQNDSWNPGAPTTLNLGSLTYYQTLFDKHLEFKIGLIAGTYEFYGSYTGGSLGGGIFGPAGAPFQEVGMPTAGVPTYGVILTGHPTQHIYDKIGVLRTDNPDGVVLEHNYNPTATRFSTPNTGALVINELGYKAEPRPSGGSTWVRFGSALSGGHYNEFDHTGHRGTDNYLFYLNADQQLLHVSRAPRQSYRGLYAGFSVSYVPPNFNLFSQYYEARIYGLGLLPHRPFDQVSLVFTNSVFSSFAYQAAKAAHRLAHPDTRSLTLSYSYSVYHGLLLNAAVGYTNNPSPLYYTPMTGSALNGILGVSLFF